MASAERQPLTKRQLAGLKRRVEQDDDDYIAFERQIGEAKILIWLDEQKILVNADGYLSDEEALKLVEALREAHEFLTYGPGEWINGAGSHRIWRSALDADGNDRPMIAAGT